MSWKIPISLKPDVAEVATGPGIPCAPWPPWAPVAVVAPVAPCGPVAPRAQFAVENGRWTVINPFAHVPLLGSTSTPFAVTHANADVGVLPTAPTHRAPQP